MPLWASIETVWLLELLATPAVLRRLNKAGVSPFDRAFVWMRTAAGGGKPFAPAQALTDRWRAADAGLLPATAGADSGGSGGASEC